VGVLDWSPATSGHVDAVKRLDPAVAFDARDLKVAKVREPLPAEEAAA